MAALSAPFGASATEPQSIRLLPHRALYDISLRSATNSSGIADIHGQMFYDLQETCDSWVTTHRFVLMYDYIDNPSSQVVSEFATKESKDGSKFEYRARRVRDGEPQEEVTGTAAKNAKGKPFVAHYSRPEKMSMELPAETNFPSAHTLSVIKNALAEKKFIRGTIFDGSDTDGAYQVSGLVLKAISEPERKRMWPKEVDTDLARKPGWRTQVAIFPLANEQEASSEYEMDMNLLENGIVTDMNIRYADFGITQTLKALTAHPRPACDAKGRPIAELPMLHSPENDLMPTVKITPVSAPSSVLREAKP